MTTIKSKDVEPVDDSSHDPESQHPLLLFCHGKFRQKQILYNLSDKSDSTYSLPDDMRNKRVVASNFGWLLIDGIMTCYLFNLHSKEKVLDLPKTTFHYNQCIFTATPTDPDCRILFLDYEYQVVRFCKVGDNEFIKQKIGNINGCSSLLRAIAFNGKVYGLSLDELALVEVEFRGARTLQFRHVVKKLGSLGRPDIECRSYVLVESCGELLCVYRSYLGYDVNDRETFDFLVYRADLERGEWVKMKSLGDRALFLSRVGGKSCSASHANVKQNCIYFVDSGDRNVYVFDMKDRSVSFSSPYRKVDNHNLDLYWI